MDSAAFGSRRVDDIGAKDVQRWHDGIAATHAGSSSWALAAMSSLMKHAKALGLRPEHSNPYRGLRWRKTGFEEHYLTDDEFVDLGRALDSAEAECPILVAALRFPLYTGARKSEAVRLRWEHMHDDRAVLSDRKAGPRTMWLGSAVRRGLRAAYRAARNRRTDLREALSAYREFEVRPRQTHVLVGTCPQPVPRPRV